MNEILNEIVDPLLNLAPQRLLDSHVMDAIGLVNADSMAFGDKGIEAMVGIAAVVGEDGANL